MEKKLDISQRQNRLERAVQRTVDFGFATLALFMALKITGTYGAVDTFFNAHSIPLLKVLLVFVVLDVILGFAAAVVKGLLSGLGEGLTKFARVAWTLLKRSKHPAV